MPSRAATVVAACAPGGSLAKEARLLVVGLTGGIGSGKSTVAAGLARRGATVFDADQVAREVLEPGRPAYEAVVARFGPGVVRPGNGLDRRALAGRVFGDPEALGDLNRITHPHVARAITQGVAALARGDAGPLRTASGPTGAARVVVLEVPLLDAAGVMRYEMKAVVVVDAPEGVAVSRLVSRRGFTAAEARARIASQVSREERRRLADVVIDNSGDLAALEPQVERAWEWMSALAREGSTGASPER